MSQLDVLATVRSWLNGVYFYWLWGITGPRSSEPHVSVCLVGISRLGICHERSRMGSYVGIQQNHFEIFVLWLCINPKAPPMRKYDSKAATYCMRLAFIDDACNVKIQALWSKLAKAKELKKDKLKNMSGVELLLLSYLENLPFVVSVHPSVPTKTCEKYLKIRTLANIFKEYQMIPGYLRVRNTTIIQLVTLQRFKACQGGELLEDQLCGRSLLFNRINF